MNAAILLNYNDAARIVASVKTLLSYDLFSPIVIVDNKSTDPQDLPALEALADGKKVILVKAEANRGYSAGFNLGLRYLSSFAPFAVLCLNSDIRISKKSCADCLSFLSQHPEIACCSTLMEQKGKPARSYFDIPTLGTTLDPWSNFRKRIHSRKDYEGYFTCGYVRESASFYNYAHFAEIGFYDERFFLFDEGPSSAFRLAEKGYQEAIVLNGERYVHDHRGHEMNRKAFAENKKSRYLFLKEYRHCNKAQLLLFKLWWVNVFIK
jgi:GT2 family glycosyltransferase